MLCFVTPDIKFLLSVVDFAEEFGVAQKAGAAQWFSTGSAFHTALVPQRVVHAQQVALADATVTAFTHGSAPAFYVSTQNKNKKQMQHLLRKSKRNTVIIIILFLDYYLDYFWPLSSRVSVPPDWCDRAGIG